MMAAMNDDNSVQMIADGYLVCFDWHLKSGTVYADYPVEEMAFIAEGI